MSTAKLETEFAKVVRLCATLERAELSPRLVARIAHAATMGIEKGITIAWLKDIDTVVDPDACVIGVVRLAERGARDFIL